MWPPQHPATILGGKGRNWKGGQDHPQPQALQLMKEISLLPLFPRYTHVPFVASALGSLAPGVNAANLGTSGNVKVSKTLPVVSYE